MPKSSAGKLFYVILPLIIYEAVLFVGESLIMIAWMIPRISRYVSEENGMIDQAGVVRDLTGLITENALLVQTILSIPAVILFIFMIRRDLPKRRFHFDNSHVSVQKWILLAILAVLLSGAGNSLLNIGDIASQSEEFAKVSQILFSGSEVLQLVGIGLIIPVCEELLFRGLLYMRMRQFMNVNYAILLSALIFAFIHGNIIQGVYAFIIGIIAAWFYEKYGSLKAPLLIHIAANLTALLYTSFLQQFIPEDSMNTVLLMIGAVCVAAAALLAFYLTRTVEAHRIYPDSV